jgi:hypothetical protein
MTAALLSAARKPFASATAQSAWILIMIESPPLARSIIAAAQVSAAAVPAGRGSAMRFEVGMSCARLAIGSTSDALVRTSVCSGGQSGAMRSSESRSNGRSLASGSSCFGRLAVLTGQKRDPTPPARITHQTFPLASGLWPPALGPLASSVTRIRLVVHSRIRLVIDAGQFRRAMQEALGAERLRHEVGRA